MKLKYITPIVMLCLLWTMSCNGKKTQDEVAEEAAYLGPDTQAFYERTEKMRNHLVGKKIPSLGDIFNNELERDEKYLIFYITGQDCGSCVLKGFNFIKGLDPILKQLVHPIGSNVNIGNIQLHYDFEEAIFPDNQDKVRKELGYFHSPMFLLYSVEKGVEDAYFIPTFDDGDRGDKFFKELQYN